MDDFVIDIVLNAANVRPGLEALVRELRGLSQEGVNADKAVSGLERIIAKLSTSTSAAGKATSVATDKNAAYSASLKSVTTQLGALEAAQAKAARQQLSQVQLPASINRDPVSGQFASADVSNLNIQQSRAVAAAYDLQTQSLRSLNAAHLKELEATGASTAAGAQKVRQLEAASRQQAIYNQYLYDEAKAAEAAKAAQLGGLGATRNALTNTSRELTTFGLGLIAISTLPVVVSTQFETAFAQVARTVEGATGKTKAALIDLSQQIPVTFKDLAAIATLGGQLGIDDSGIIDFTATVAKLTATTDLSAESAGTFLGRVNSLLDVPYGQFENIASAILKVGVNSVATETQIVSIATRIAGAGKTLKLSAFEVIGFAGALASVGVKPYAASGTVTRLASVIKTATSEGGADLKILADTAGVTAGQFQKAFASNKFDPIFTKLIQGFGDTAKNGGDVKNILDKIGISGSTDVQTFRQLAAGTKSVAEGGGAVGQAFRDANSQINSTKALTDQYGIVAATTASKMKILVDNVLAFFNSIGTGQQGVLNELVTNLGDFIGTLKDLSSTDAGQRFLAISAGAGVLVGVLTLLLAGGARATAGILGLTQSLVGLNSEGLLSNGILAGLRTQLELTGTAGVVASKGLGIFGGALKLFTAAAVGLTAGFFLFQIAGGLLQSGDAARKNNIEFKKLTGSTKQAGDALDAYLKKANLSGAGSATRGNNVAGLQNAQNDPVAILAKQINNRQGPVAKAIDNFSGGTAGRLSGQTQSLEALGKLDKALSGLVKNGDGQKAAALFSELQDRARKGGADVADFAGQFVKYNKAVDQAAQATARAAAANDRFNQGTATAKDMVTLLADATGLNEKAQGKYADAYAKSVGNLVDFNSVVQQVQQSQQAALGSNATQAQQNAATAVSLGALTEQYKTNNAAQADWAKNLVAVAAAYGPDAANQFIQAGYSAVNSSILQQLVNASPEQGQAYVDASQKAAGLAAEATAQKILLSGYIVTDAGDQVSAATAKAFSEQLAAGIGIPEAMAALGLHVAGQKQPVVTPTANTDPAQAQINAFITNNAQRHITFLADLRQGTNSTGYGTGSLLQVTQQRANGGYIRGAGTGTSDSIPARLSNGEYVIKAAAVRKYGAGMFDQLNRGVAKFANGGPVRKYAGGGQVSSVVSLSPRDRMAMSGRSGDIVIMVDGREIARAVNNSNGQSGALGAN